jgi:DNA repair protein RecN (Recombination protein N)
MLGLKAALAERLDHGVMLLDEIEAGLGGDVAYKVARVFAELAEHRQVVAITHLPVVAANSQHHLVSRKETDSQQTQVVYEPVAAEARRRELHRMVGDTGSEAGLAFVDELLAEGQ